MNIARLSGVSTLEELATVCGTALLERPVLGPWRLGGWCFGGFLAFETALFLTRAGAEVDRLILIDAFNPAWNRNQKWASVTAARWKMYRSRAAYHIHTIFSSKSPLHYLSDRAHAFVHGRHEDLVSRSASVQRRALTKDWNPRHWKGEALLVCEPGRRLDAPQMGWNGIIEEIREEVVPFYQTGPFAGERIAVLTKIVQNYLTA